MTKKTTLLKAGFLAMALLGFSGLAHAATFAYVNQAGDVSAVVANDPYEALRTAPNIDEHSGVILLNTTGDALIGDHVSVN